MSGNVMFTVFSKPWKLELPDLAKKVQSLGFDGIELPVRPGFQVTPDRIAEDLPKAVEIFKDHDLRIASVAAEPVPEIIEAMGRAGTPLLRTLVRIPQGENYMRVIDDAIEKLQSLVPLLDQAGVKVGIQNHCNREVSSTMGLRYLVAPFAPKHVGAVLDIGHCGLAGEDIDEALDMVESHLCLVNFKNAYWYRSNGPEAPYAQWETYWTTGTHGMMNWSDTVKELRKRQYAGDICLTAEYSDGSSLERFVAEDLRLVKSLFEERMDTDHDSR